ncbi:RING-H2 finger protein ATL48-like isoform X1 [Miscanthus floridulus]|uniref:RING-H2 finger protein ATL48-like isoform X1 n=1 Tax=Miscanthus floridulus TaxID=154761 RepID=UPI003457F21E
MEKGSGGSAPPPPLHMEDFQLEGKKPVKNPFVPIGMCTGYCWSSDCWSDQFPIWELSAGSETISFRYGNSQLGQKLMRAYVFVQGATVALMIGSAYYYGDEIKLFKKGSSP